MKPNIAPILWIFNLIIFSFDINYIFCKFAVEKDKL